MRKKRLGPSRRAFAITVSGAACFLVLHLVFLLTWERWFVPAELEQPWFLGSRRSIVLTQVTLGAVAAVLAMGKPACWRDRFVRSGLLLAGAMTAMIGTFLLIGPAEVMLGPVRLWPIVLVSAFLLLAPAVVAGTLIGGLGRS